MFFLFKNLTERNPAISDHILFFRIEESIFALSTRAPLSKFAVRRSKTTVTVTPSLLYDYIISKYLVKIN